MHILNAFTCFDVCKLWVLYDPQESTGAKYGDIVCAPKQSRHDAVMGVVSPNLVSIPIDFDLVTKVFVIVLPNLW